MNGGNKSRVAPLAESLSAVSISCALILGILTLCVCLCACEPGVPMELVIVKPLAGGNAESVWVSQEVTLPLRSQIAYNYFFVDAKRRDSTSYMKQVCTCLCTA